MVADDAILQGNISGLELSGLYLKGDTISAIMYGLSRNCFLYYLGLRNVMNSDGGMFSSPAGNPPSNLSDESIGYFQVSPQYTSLEIANP